MERCEVAAEADRERGGEGGDAALAALEGHHAARAVGWHGAVARDDAAALGRRNHAVGLHPHARRARAREAAAAPLRRGPAAPMRRGRGGVVIHMVGLGGDARLGGVAGEGELEAEGRGHLGEVDGRCEYKAGIEGVNRSAATSEKWLDAVGCSEGLTSSLK